MSRLLCPVVPAPLLRRAQLTVRESEDVRLAAASAMQQQFRASGSREIARCVNGESVDFRPRFRAYQKQRAHRRIGRFDYSRFVISHKASKSRGRTAAMICIKLPCVDAIPRNTVKNHNTFARLGTVSGRWGETMMQQVRLLQWGAHGTEGCFVAVPLNAQGVRRSTRIKRHSLTARELEVLTWVAQGKSAWEVGEILHIAKRTVDEHVQTAVRKMGAVNRTHAVAMAIRDRIISI